MTWRRKKVKKRLGEAMDSLTIANVWCEDKTRKLEIAQVWNRVHDIYGSLGFNDDKFRHLCNECPHYDTGPDCPDPCPPEYVVDVIE